MKEKNIQELAVRMQLVTVEDMCQYTVTQLVTKIANKVNELVNEVGRFEADVQEYLRTQNENIQYLLDEGLHLEVENIFDGWVNDGTFDTLINQSALETVNARIDALIKLEAGSTTGDAELIDARVGADGKNYGTLGNAVRRQINKIVTFDKSDNLFNPKDVVIGKIISYEDDKSISYLDQPDFSCILVEVEESKSYTVTALSYTSHAFDENLKRINSAKVVSGSTEKNVTITSLPVGTRYISICFRHKSIPANTFMIVEGNSLPSTYKPYYNHLYLNKDVIIDTGGEISEKIYHIGKGKNYENLITAIRALKDDTSNKVFLLDSGEYDLFEEMGGKAYFDSLDSSKTWQEINYIVPANTKIKCVNGRATLKFMPSSKDISEELASLISPLNFIYDAYLENVSVIATNCRYAIHDESGKYPEAIGKSHIYKNVILDKILGDKGINCCFGCGFIGNNNFEFDGCVFTSDERAFSIHNTGELGKNDTTDIVIKNCAFITSSESQRALNLRNVNGNQAHVTVQIINTTLEGKLIIQNETTTERPNAFDVTIIGGKIDTTENKCATNIYPLKKY